MAPHLVSRAPQCLSCIRRVARLGDAIPYPAGQQIRGKKRTSKIPTVNVQLLQNIPGYGRKGSVVPVTRGIMRNTWFPRKMADYATAATLEDLEKEDAAPERDSIFGSKQERRAARATQAEAQTQAAPLEEELPVELPLLSPQEATDIISKFLPQNIDFYRTPIIPESTEPQPLKRVSPSIPASSAISAAAAKGHVQKTEPAAQRKTGIYGSVSTSDIAANVQAMLAEVYNGSPIVLSPENISFIDKTEEGNRVKHLGTFAIEIRLSGAIKKLDRTITVKVQE